MLALIKLLGAATAVEAVKERAQIELRRVLWMVVSAIFGLIALGFLVAALWWQLANYYDPLFVDALLGLSALFLAAITYFISRIQGTKPPPKKLVNSVASVASAATGAASSHLQDAEFKAVGAEVKNLTHSIIRKPMTLPLIVLGGFILGRKLMK